MRGIYLANQSIDRLSIAAPPTGYPLLGHIWQGFEVAVVNGVPVPEMPMPMNHFSGQLLKTNAEVRWTGHIGHLLTEFTATGLYELFGIPGDKLVNTTVPVALLAPQFDRAMTERLKPLQIDGYVEGLCELLKDQASKAIRAPDFVTEAVRQIEGASGDVKLGELAKHLHTSDRSFREHFQSIVGVPPKFFCRAVQFNYVVSIVMSEEEVPLAQLASEAGYYDQAHFCRVFREYVLTTPRDFFKSDHSKISSFIRQNRTTYDSRQA
ncbi:helix-turn-helix domain-containing protein [Coralliovum pocilloporae]|uniref:helix-turn-helix domain-containing protein n=1 Tax=Coralliovum pocilloporae TaxID=3066369 RepID=UPI0033077841